MAGPGEGPEQHFLLRIQDAALADQVRSILREEGGEVNAGSMMELLFEDAADPRLGKLVTGGNTYPVKVLDLPTVVESYKTYDDINLVKSTDVGQMILVLPVGATPPVMPESTDGVTPPMRKARQRHFRRQPAVGPNIVAKVEEALVAILRGSAPEGMEFVDVEEEYVVDASTGKGGWKPVKPTAVVPK